MARKLYFLDLTDPNDLAINRQGRVSPNQIEAYKGLPKTSFFFNWLMAFLCILGSVVLGAYFSPLTSSFPTQNQTSNIWIIGVLAGIAGAMLLTFISTRSSRLIRRKMLEEGNVQPLDGEVVWEFGNYKPKTSKGYLKPISTEVISTVLPGRYRFYVLAETKFLLTAEPLEAKELIQSPVMIMEPTTQNIDLLSILARTNHFDVSSLEYNRAGRLSPSQFLRLLFVSGQYTLGAILIAIIGIRLYQYTVQDGEPNTSLLFLFAGIAILLICLQAWYLLDVLRSDIKSVKSAVGKEIAETHKSNGWYRTSYFYTAGSHQRWKVSKSAYNALVEGVVYKAYYTSRREILVAIEPVATKEN